MLIANCVCVMLLTQYLYWLSRKVISANIISAASRFGGCGFWLSIFACVFFKRSDASVLFGWCKGLCGMIEPPRHRHYWRTWLFQGATNTIDHESSFSLLCKTCLLAAARV